jgi:hypothetical protein
MAHMVPIGHIPVEAIWPIWPHIGDIHVGAIWPIWHIYETYL